MPKQEVAGLWGGGVAVLMFAATSGCLYKWRDTAREKEYISLRQLISKEKDACC